MTDLSPIDIRILEALQKDSAQSTSELADKVGLSQSPCWRRLQRLRDEGYISREVAILNPDKFGPTITVFANLKMGTLTDDKRAEFIRKVEISPHILECYSVIGDDDIIMKIVAPSLEWFQNYLFKTILRLPGVQSVRSTVTTTQVKKTTAIPLNRN